MFNSYQKFSSVNLIKIKSITVILVPFKKFLESLLNEKKILLASIT